jgi:hypothetical protein
MTRYTNQNLSSAQVVAGADRDGEGGLRRREPGAAVQPAADLAAGAVAHQRGQTASTARPTSHKGKIAARLAAAFGVPTLCDVRTDRVNVVTLGVPSPRRRIGDAAAKAG